MTTTTLIVFSYLLGVINLHAAHEILKRYSEDASMDEFLARAPMDEILLMDRFARIGILIIMLTTIFATMKAAAHYG